MKSKKHYIFTLLIVLLALRVFIPQLDALQESFDTLKEADLYWVMLGVIVYFLSVPAMTLQFMGLSMKKLALGLTFKVEAATLFVNKLLPNGVGTISLNFYYLVKKEHTPSQATAVLTVNSITSLIAYCLLILLAITNSSISLDGLQGEISLPLNLIFFIFILLLGAGYTLYQSDEYRKKINSAWKQLKKDFATFKDRPKALMIGVLCNGIGSATSIFALMASAQALGFHITFADAILAYTFGNIASALVPTPGGIGSAEAGIYSGLVLTGLAGPDALMVTLLYRFISYWLPIIPGYYYFWGLRKTLLSDYKVKN